MQLPQVYRVTKYDPADRDEAGYYVGAEEPVSDHGVVEAAYLGAIEAFAADAGVEHLAVREPHLPPPDPFDTAPSDGPGLGGLLPVDGPTGPTGLTGPADFFDGATVPLHTALELVRGMLRERGPWCRLEAEGALTVHIGWDQYLYVGTAHPSEPALDLTAALGLFAERLPSSPYDIEAEGWDVQRPGDDTFWARVRWAVASGAAGLLEEEYAGNATRWHHLTPETLDAVRTGMAPRARMAVWPPLSPDVDAVLRELPHHGLVEGVWEDGEGHLHSAVAEEDEHPELAVRLATARAAALHSTCLDDRVPLLTAVLPDDDGVVRARWRTEPTPSDRNWAFLTTLSRGQTVTGTVTHIADSGVTFVDIGGFQAIVNIPELSRRPIAHPSDVVCVGEEIDAKILDIDLVRERVSLSLRAAGPDGGRRLSPRAPRRRPGGEAAGTAG